MKSEKHITVLLADDHAIVREGLCRLLDDESDIEVVAQAANGREAVTMAKQYRPDVVVIDVAMPRMNGLEATAQIRLAIPGARVIILSAHSDDAYVEKVISLGAVGYLVKQSSAEYLSEAIREVHKGNTFFSPSVSRRRGHLNQKSINRKGVSKVKKISLSSREIEVLQLIAEGDANKQIAEALGISVKTVEKHRNHLMEKLAIHDTAGLTRYAIETGVIESSVQVTTVQP